MHFSTPYQALNRMAWKYFLMAEWERMPLADQNPTSTDFPIKALALPIGLNELTIQVLESVNQRFWAKRCGATAVC